MDSFGDTSLATARDLDGRDELSGFRAHFDHTEKDLIYLDGNSLGRLPGASPGWISEVVSRQWGRRLIRGWNEGWIDAPVRIGKKIARLVGAAPEEVIMTDATSINLFKLAVAALRHKPGRTGIISDELNFPSDLYVLQGVIDLFGGKHTLALARSDDGITIDPERITELLSPLTALLTLTHTCYKSAFVHDMARLTEAAHEQGALVMWDLSHSAGALELDLAACRADLAVGCTYKYLNGGPGAPAFLYVRKDLQEQLVQPIWGWLGADRPFDFEPDFTPANDMTRFQVGTPPIISLLAVEPGLDLHLEAGMDRIRKKSMRQTEYLLYLFDRLLHPLGFTLGSPRNPAIRGSHVSVKHPEAYRINRAMIEAGPPDLKVIPDFRTPDNIRLGVAAIYNSFEDICLSLYRMKDIVDKRIYEKYPHTRLSVT